MTRVGLLSIAIFSSLISTILTQQASDLMKCWSCNTVDHWYCNDPFDSNKPDTAEKLWSLHDCPNGRCVKTIINTAGGQPLVNRSCVLTPQMAEEHCKTKAFTFCESCATDLCNGAAQYGPTALIVAVLLAIANIFVF